LHLAGATLLARGLGFAERFDLINDYRRLAQRGFQCAAAQTVDACFAKTPPRAFAALWAPLCLAALNTPPQYASARVFAEVLREEPSPERAGTAISSFLPSTSPPLFPMPQHAMWSAWRRRAKAKAFAPSRKTAIA
jgi:hypothetical protein